MKLLEEDFQVIGIQLHIYRSGTDKPPLVFAHGITDNGLCFLPIAEQLSDDFEIILYDARGHGKSEASQTKTTYIDRAQDLADLIRTLGLHKPCLLGHSMGAVTVALFAGLYPQVPGCILLEDPPPFEMLAPDEKEAPDRHKHWRELAALNKQKSIQELVHMSRTQNPTWPEAERLPWAQSKQQVSLTVFDNNPVDVKSAQEIVSRIACPALILTADLKMGALFPAEAAEEMVAGLPGSRHVNILGAGHNIRREQPVAYLQAVREFLKVCRTPDPGTQSHD